jgi:hypothetical protein
LLSGYFAYKKFTLSYEYCKSFGEIHSEIGWTLKKNIDSCLKLTNKISGEVFFDTKIYTDRNGFRIHKFEQSVSSDILAIGDSWTFGYGVNGDETYPYFLSKLLEKPIYNSGIPAFGSASTYLYTKFNVEKLNPKIVIYLSKGLWQRSICLKPWSTYLNEETADKKTSLHHRQLIPCYLYDHKDSRVRLIKPLPGVVDEAAKKHIFPGGSLTAGYDSLWKYIIFTKPKLIIQDFKERLGLAAVKKATPFEGYNIKKYELNSFLELAAKNNFQFFLIDPSGDYEEIINNANLNYPTKLSYIGKSYWGENISKELSGFLESELFIPNDGHYTKKMNEILANLIYKKILSDSTLILND